MSSKPNLRDRHVEQTRELILDALVDQLAQSGAFEFSYFEVARRAGVSVRTLYRHFPTKEDLFHAVSERLGQTLGGPLGVRTLPADPAALVDLVPKLFAVFDEHEALLRAHLSTRIGQDVRRAGRPERANNVRKAVDVAGPHLDEAERRRIAAVLATLVSADTWSRMKADFGLDGREAGDAVAWALGELFSAIERKSREQGRE